MRLRMAEERNFAVAQAVADLAEELGRTMAQVALNWVAARARGHRTDPGRADRRADRGQPRCGGMDARRRRPEAARRCERVRAGLPVRLHRLDPLAVSADPPGHGAVALPGEVDAGRGARRRDDRSARDRRRPRLGGRRHRRPGSGSPVGEPRSCSFAHATLVGDDVRITLPDGSVASDDDALSVLARSAGHPDPRRRRRRRARSRSGSPRTTTPTATRPSSGTGGRDPSAPSTTRPAPRCRSSGPARSATWDMRRFRPNVVIDGTGEDDWVGSTLRLGDAVVDVSKQIDRCVMTTRPQPGGIERDLDVLRTINRERAEQPRDRDAGADAGHRPRRRRRRTAGLSDSDARAARPWRCAS